MKSVRELRNSLNLNPEELTSTLKYFIKQNVDWLVYLPTRGRNLQRDFVWTLDQKRELINSMIVDRHIPHASILSIVDPNDGNNDILQIIDGKQRLSTMCSFYRDEFTIIIDNVEYYFKDLPTDYQLAISNYRFRYYVVNEPYNKPITDDEKIQWFKFINFAGTPQDAEYLANLN